MLLIRNPREFDRQRVPGWYLFHPHGILRGGGWIRTRLTNSGGGMDGRKWTHERYGHAGDRPE